MTVICVKAARQHTHFSSVLLYFIDLSNATLELNDRATAKAQTMLDLNNVKSSWCLSYWASWLVTQSFRVFTWQPALRALTYIHFSLLTHKQIYMWFLDCCCKADVRLTGLTFLMTPGPPRALGGADPSSHWGGGIKRDPCCWCICLTVPSQMSAVSFNWNRV